ncbi:MAG: beta-propeller fold lactonase family protein [Enterobacteriaceae bacterium]
MYRLSRACLAGIFVFPGCFSYSVDTQAANAADTPEPTRVIFVAGFNSGYLQCFHVDKQTGYLTDIPQCDKDFSKDLPSVSLYDLEFHDNHLYLISSLGEDTLEYDIDPKTLILSNPRRFRHGVDTFAGFLFDDVGYFPSTRGNKIYQFSISKKDGSLTPLSPPYIDSGKVQGPGFIAQSLLNKNLFYVGGWFSGNIRIFRRSQDGTLHDTGITTVMPGQYRTRHIAAYRDFLYVTNQANDTVFQFRVDRTDGHLISLNPPFISTRDSYPGRTIINGDNAYTPNVLSSTVTSFTIKADGTLAYKNPAVIPIGLMPFQLIVDNQAHRLYVNSESSPWISSVRVNPDGSLDTSVVRFQTHAPDPRYFLETEIHP